MGRHKVGSLQAVRMPAEERETRIWKFSVDEWT